MNDEITVSRDQLFGAFLRWEQDMLAGNVMSAEDLAAMSVEQRAELGVDALLMHLEALGAPA